MSVPVVPLSSFSNLAGAALATDLRGLLARGGQDWLVLFSDMRGENLAILPVGPGRPHANIDQMRGIEIEGLRPLCALRCREEPVIEARTDERADRAHIEESLAARERYIAECEQRLAEVGHALSEREAMLEQREQMLISKEREFFRRSGEMAREEEVARARASLSKPA